MRSYLPLAAGLTFCAAVLRGEILVKNGEKIAFLGDSITESGWSSPNGYVKLVIAGLRANEVNAEAVPAGISGNKSNQMLERLGRDVLTKRPHWMTLSCGVNDVWHGKNGVPLELYQENITKILELASSADVKVVILTATVIHEQLDSPQNLQLAGYNQFLRALAHEHRLPLADLNALFHERIKAEKPAAEKLLTTDGVHMNDAGNRLMARGVLRAFGLDEAQLAKAEAAWSAKP